MMFDTKTNFLSFVDQKLWPFKGWRYPKIAKFWKAHNTPPRGPRAEKFWISEFLPRGYLDAKNDQNRWGKGVKLLPSVLEWAYRDADASKKKSRQTDGWSHPLIVAFERLKSRFMTTENYYKKRLSRDYELHQSALRACRMLMLSTERDKL